MFDIKEKLIEKALQVQEKTANKYPQPRRSSPADFSSAWDLCRNALRDCFSMNLEMKKIYMMTRLNQTMTSFFESEATLKVASVKPEAAEHEAQVLLAKAKTEQELNQHQSREELYKAESKVEEAKEELELSKDEDLQSLRKQKLMAGIQKSIAKLDSRTRGYNAIDTDKQEPSPKISPEGYRERMMGRLDVKAEDIAALDKWKRDQLQELEEAKEEELAAIEAGPGTLENKQKRRLETEARYAKRREQILSMNPWAGEGGNARR